MSTAKKAILAALVIGVVVAGTIIIPSDVFGLEGSVRGGVEAARGADVPSILLGDGGMVTRIVNIMLFVVGFLSVIMLIWGGLRYVISGGNSSAVTAAKNTILYAIVGLIIAIFAYAIVNFVIGSFTDGAMGSGGTNV